MLNKKSLFVILVLVLGLLLVACQPEVVTETVVVTQVVTETVEVAGEQVEVTRVVEETITQEVEVEVTREVEVDAPVDDMDMAKPVTLHWNWGTEPPTLDPSQATDTTSVDAIRNLFVTLTQFDAVTGEVLPYLATEWESW